MNDDFDEEIARLWAQANGVKPPKPQPATPEPLARYMYGDPARFIPGAVDKHRKTTKNKPRKDTPKWHS